MNVTTLAAAMTATDLQASLVSGTGVTGRGEYNVPTAILYVEEEAMEVVSITGLQSATLPSVRRGALATKITAHPIGARVHVATPSETSPSYSSPPRTPGPNQPNKLVTTLNTAGDLTLTTAQILGGLILRDPNGGARTDTLPTAALLLAAMPAGVLIDTSFRFTIRNTADAAETITVAAGTGGTLSGTATIAQNNSKEFLVVFTNVSAGSEAYTAYSLGTVVH